jgi:hypothetical protein
VNTGPISLAIFFGFFLLSAYSLRRAFLVFLLLSPFLPGYIAFPLGSDGSGISAFRLASYSIFLVFVASLISDPNSWVDVWRCWMREKAIVAAFIILTVSRAASTIVYQEPRMMFYVLDEFILIFSLLLLSTRVFMNNKSILELRTIYSVSSVLLLSFLMIEVLGQRPVLSYFLNVTVTIVGEGVFEGFVRDGRYRAQSFFDNPLSFAEFLLYTSVMFLFLFRKTNARNGWAYAIVGVLMLMATFATGARFAFVVVVIIFSSYIIFRVFKTVSVTAQKVLILSSLMAILVAVFSLSAILEDIENYIDLFSFLIVDDVSSLPSLISRANQWIAIPAEVTSNQFLGILGEGYRSDLIERIDIRLDSYYFRLLIEGGWLAVAAFLLVYSKAMLSCAIFSRSRARILSKLSVSDAAFFLSIFFTIFFVTKLFLSMNFNNYLLFVFLGLLVSLHSRTKANAHSPHP